jgi:XTP/dITP diphosphohydrolase
MNLVFATHNDNKVIEIQNLISNKIKVLGLNQINCFDEIIENKKTIEANAILKAEYISDKYQLNCFADDTGLEVESLNGLPGVKSKRFTGENSNSEKNMDKLLSLLRTKSNRKARFKTVIALIYNKKLTLFTGTCDGFITFEKRGNKGFGYDPIFLPNGFDITFAEMNLKQKNSISHRAKAMNQLVNYLSKK